MLNEAQIARYHEKGYVIPDYRLSDDVLTTIRRDHDRLLDRHPDFRDNCPALLSHDLAFLNYARDSEILDMAEQLIGPDIALWNMSFFAKPAVNGKKTPFHQDGEYWPIRPMATCTVWIAIDDATVENGCLRIIPGSHKEKRLLLHDQKNDPNYTLQQELNPSEYDEAEAEDLILEAGQMSFHDVFLSHGSEINTSPNPRRGMTLRLMPTSSVFDRDVADQMAKARGGITLANHSLFLLRGRDLSGTNDYRLRQPWAA
ncbi:MAG: phytanoyl-CoA dioxygenase family protein [Rhodospirillaceae bacterium]|jgi:ectoine hydroxylase-related dioxygenase (phytanoyl-CoA dioxygenase family)|nr:phytanoyl-CoA dioxygenase family protein [Rhodospirillaceae bacterium]MBT4691079.1 phytanoyl-CoA dioxygenase family protein [Rhodospirillaceae bacterium]MBT5191519.1 phytanoyl-CoA dioxygenase family protein [Rhodospirillaceae bacterium]MBT5898005.1 phytanoyl-CoA dioxygenase family protein [Rhodospirillaceae bacterium]MBT6428376.1 phytanoyl-CoA dioxygenase family protein [Rhodospirillaceae bacterium]